MDQSINICYNCRHRRVLELENFASQAWKFGVMLASKYSAIQSQHSKRFWSEAEAETLINQCNEAGVTSESLSWEVMKHFEGLEGRKASVIQRKWRHMVEGRLVHYDHVNQEWKWNSNKKRRLE